MKLIIDISKYTIDIAKLGNVISDADNEIVAKAIANGILLPKEHGRLIDADSLLSKFDETYRSKIGLVPDCLAEGFVQCEKLIKNEPTIYEGVKNANRNSLIPTGKPVGLYDNPK